MTSTPIPRLLLAVLTAAASGCPKYVVECTDDAAACDAPLVCAQVEDGGRAFCVDPDGLPPPDDGGEGEGEGEGDSGFVDGGRADAGSDAGFDAGVDAGPGDSGVIDLLTSTRAVPAGLARGDETRVEWALARAAACALTFDLDDGGTVQIGLDGGQVASALDGGVAVQHAPSGDGTYFVTCTEGEGPGQTQSTHVEVAFVDVGVSPRAVASGDSVSVSVTGAHLGACTLTEAAVDGGAMGATSIDGGATDTPTETQDYVASCATTLSGVGPVTDRETVHVISVNANYAGGSVAAGTDPSIALSIADETAVCTVGLTTLISSTFRDGGVVLTSADTTYAVGPVDESVRVDVDCRTALEASVVASDSVTVDVLPQIDTVDARVLGAAYIEISWTGRSLNGCAVGGETGAQSATSGSVEIPAPAPAPGAQSYEVVCEGTGADMDSSQAAVVRWGDVNTTADLGGVTLVTGGIALLGETASSYVFPDLVEVGGNFQMSGDTAANGLYSIELEALRRVGGVLSIYDNVDLAGFVDLDAGSFPSLEQVGGLTLSNNDATALIGVSFPMLVAIDGPVTIQGNANLATIDVPVLDTQAGDLLVGDNPVLACAEIDALQCASDDVTPNINNNLAVCAVPPASCP